MGELTKKFLKEVWPYFGIGVFGMGIIAAELEMDFKYDFKETDSKVEYQEHRSLLSAYNKNTLTLSINDATFKMRDTENFDDLMKNYDSSKASELETITVENDDLDETFERKDIDVSPFAKKLFAKCDSVYNAERKSIYQRLALQEQKKQDAIYKRL